jgi:hypothetical protein
MKPKVLLDSGAFSAWKSGFEIDIYSYIDFVRKYGELFEAYFVLDVVGDGEKTWENQEIMEKEGLSPIPIYHTSTDIQYLYKCLEYPYFGLSVTGTSNFLGKMQANERCFSIICDDDGYPRSKVHGLGVTSPKFIIRYPYYSVDSISWVINSRYGHIIIPKLNKVEPDFESPPRFISVCKYSRYTDEFTSPKYIYNCSNEEREKIFEYLAKINVKFGKSEFKYVQLPYRLRENEQWAEAKKTSRDGKRRVEIIVEPGVMNSLRERDKVNIFYYQQLEKALKYPRKFNKSIALF